MTPEKPEVALALAKPKLPETKAELLAVIAQARLEAAKVRVRRASRRVQLIELRLSSDEDLVVAMCDVDLTKVALKEQYAQVALAELNTKACWQSQKEGYNRESEVDNPPTWKIFRIWNKFLKSAEYIDATRYL